VRDRGLRRPDTGLRVFAAALRTDGPTETTMAEPPRSFARHPVFHAGELDAHHRFGVADEAERMSDVVTTRLSIGVRQFVESQPLMFVGTTCGEPARVTCDIVQGMRDANGDLWPVVRVIDTKTLRFALPVPDHGDGTRIDPRTCDGSGVGLLFVDFMRGIRYRINGRATLRTDLPEADAAPWPAASPIVELAVAQAYGNCGTRVVRLRPDV
jgi:predicted pyridoxine 5'-phosphate oxidase superfamily flavin-nucleotide-binding protein